VDNQESFSCKLKIRISLRPCYLKLTCGEKAFDTGLQQTCFICNQVLSGDTESVNLHIDGCLARVNSEDNDGSSLDRDTAPKSSASPPIFDGEGDGTPEAAWEEYEWAGQRRVRATAMFEGGYGGKVS
jgi:E3 ubiquitin-protein ligase RNF220